MNFNTTITIIIGLFISGCSLLSTQQLGQITSDPQGAHVYFYEPKTGKRKDIGQTPTNAKINQGLFDIYIVAELAGYDKDSWLVPKSGEISYNFKLSRDIAFQIQQEVGSYSPEYIKRVLDVVGKCDRVISSPRMLAGSAASEARVELQKIRIDFQKYKGNATDRAMARLVDYAEALTGVPSQSYNSQYEMTLALDIQSLVKQIRAGLGV